MARRPEPARFLLVVAYRPRTDSRAGGTEDAAGADVERPGPGNSALLLRPTTWRPTWIPASTSTRGPTTSRRSYERAPTATRSSSPICSTTSKPTPSSRGVTDIGRRPARSRRWPEAAPESLRPFIDATLERLPDDQQRVLEAASVCGLDFATAAVAAALGVYLSRPARPRPGPAGWPRAVHSRRRIRLPARWHLVAAIRVHTRAVSRGPGPARARGRAHAPARGALPSRAKWCTGPAVDRIATELALHFERAAEPRKAYHLPSHRLQQRCRSIRQP